MSRFTRWGFAVRTCAVAATAALVAVAPAGAAIYDREIYKDDYAFSYDECGFPVDVTGRTVQRLTLRTGTGPDEGAFFLHNRYSYVETHTNAETGNSLTIEMRGLFHELKATRVSGSVFEFTAIEAGQPFSLYDSDGDLVLRDRGSVQLHIVADTLGDAEPGGEIVAELEPRLNGPHPSWDTDHCSMITPLIGS